VAPPDAGVDGGEPDAGALDGGEVDGGEEHAGALDAGHVQDGGASDAGPLEDAGEAVDAGTGGSGGTGCGCTSTPGALWLGLLAVLAWRRRGAGPVRVGVTRR
jgi:uncharacterized protein (TIGR03382 family)